MNREQGLREAKALIEAADNLAIAARHLRTCRLHGVPAGELGTIEDRTDRSRYGMGMGRLVLFAVIVELCIKGLRLLEEPTRQVVRRHVVVELYRDLPPDTQAAIEAIYERCREQHAHVVQVGGDKTKGVVCQRRSKSTPLAGVKMHHLMRFSPALAVVPVVHRRDPRCFV